MLLVDSEDPVTALERRGLPTSGHVELRLDPIITDAPQLAELGRWAARNGAGPGIMIHRPRLPGNRSSGSVERWF